MKRLATVTAVVIGLGALPAPAAAEPAETSLTLNYSYIEFMGNEAEAFFGDVGSSRRKCVEAREVNIFRKRPGRDQSFGSVLSGSATRNGPSDWEASWLREVVNNEEGPDTRSGRFYAVTDATDGCKKGESELFRVVRG